MAEHTDIQEYQRFKLAFQAGAEQVIIHKKELNDINVFPVSDGDTGNNLAALMQTIKEAIDGHFPSTLSLFERLADASLVGARGNSGNILAQYFNGLDRLKIGDISVHQSFAQVCVSKKMVSVFTESVSKIARSGVKISEVSPNDFVRLPEQATNQVVMLSSLRIDKAIASIFNKSRSFAQGLIQSSKVKVNYTEIMQNDFELTTGDLISVRGLGRVKIGQNLGLTKKDKVRIEVQIISSQK